MRRIRITYQTVTDESAEFGEAADSGWIDEEGACIEPDDYDVDEHGSESAAAVALAVKMIGKGCEASDGPRCHVGHTWYTEVDGDTDYSDNSVTTQSFHLDGFSEEEELAIYAEITGR